MESSEILIVGAVLAGIVLLVVVPIRVMITATELHKDGWATGIAIGITAPPIGLLLSMAFLAVAPPRPPDIDLTADHSQTPDSGTASDSSDMWAWASAAVVLVGLGIAAIGW